MPETYDVLVIGAGQTLQKERHAAESRAMEAVKSVF